MQQEKYSKVLTALFGTFITGVMLTNFASPVQATSTTENRSLAQQPELVMEAVMDGSYMTDLETFLSDQFVGRDHWVALKSTLEKILMKQENNAVYFGTDDTLLVHVDTPDPELMKKNADYLSQLAENVTVPVYGGIIPSATSVWADRLPAYAPTADEEGIINTFYGDLSNKVTTLPLFERLSAQSHLDLYYRTDHHWTTLGAYFGYATIAQSMGLSPVSLEDYTETVVSDSFFGTTYSTSGVRWVKPDKISTYVPEDGLKVTSNFSGTPEEGALYVPSYLDVKDKYSYFLGGVQPLCIIETAHTDAPKLLIVRDSYTDCMVPFLTNHFSEIHLLDLRYYNAGVSGYVTNNEIDEVLVLYSLTNFVNDQHLFKLSL